MANTELSDVFVPEIFASYKTLDSTEKTLFVESGVAVTNPQLEASANNAGFITTLPFWNDLDASIEPNMSNTTFTDLASPQKVTTGEQIARIAYLNDAFSSSDLIKEIAGDDPMKLINARLDRFWAKQFQRRILAMAVGLYNDNVADNGGDMVNDVSVGSGSVLAANKFNHSAFIDAVFTMGDMEEDLNVIAMHSVVFKTLVNNELIVYLRDSQGQLTIPAYMGKRVIIDDGMPTIGSGTYRKYVSIIFGSGAFGYGNGTPKTPEEVYRYPDRANGGGVEVLWTRKTWMIHPLGYQFTSTTITGPGLSPTWADLNLATNWTRVVPRKNVPLAFLITNG